MNLKLYNMLGTKSRRAIRRTKKAFGHPYVYRPRSHLITRLSQQTGMTRTEVYNQLMAERQFFIDHPNLM